MRYPMPAADIEAPHTAVFETHKSRFIGWGAGIGCIEDAQRLLALARQHYPDASHHCSAYIAGPPGEDQAIGFSDDGEPGGTAGRPIYQVLDGSRLGQIACVVTRYFGGTKLGTGGLARAYTQTASDLIATLPTRQHIPRRRVSLGLAFADEQAAREWLAQHESNIAHADYHVNGVTLSVDWPMDAAADFAELDAQLSGRLANTSDQL